MERQARNYRDDWPVTARCAECSAAAVRTPPALGFVLPIGRARGVYLADRVSELTRARRAAAIVGHPSLRGRLSMLARCTHAGEYLSSPCGCGPVDGRACEECVAHTYQHRAQRAAAGDWVCDDCRRQGRWRGRPGGAGWRPAPPGRSVTLGPCRACKRVVPVRTTRLRAMAAEAAGAGRRDIYG